MRKSTSLKSPALLIAAISGRAIAQSARRAGFVPLVADFFADLDTQDAAHACRKLDGDIARGIEWAALSRALEALAAESPSPILGLVYGSGFEDRPKVLTRIAKSWTLLGNDEATVARLKDPESFFGEFDRLGVAHPATASKRPAKGEGASAWLVKRKGGAGGSHIGVSGTARARGKALLPGACRRPRRLGPFRRQRQRGARARLQRAMDRAIQAKPVALWRGGPPCPSCRSRQGGDDLGGRAGSFRLQDQGTGLGRFHSGWAKRAPARDQPATRRDDRHLRKFREPPHWASSRRGDAKRSSRAPRSPSKAPWPRPSSLRRSRFRCPSP